MPQHYVPMPISYNLGGIKKSAFPEADHNLHATISLEDWLNSWVCPVVSYLCAVASCRWVTLAFISATFLIMLLFVFALCESFSLPSCSQMCRLPLFIPLPVARVSLQLADLQLTWAFASVEVYWSMKERGHRRAILASCRPYGDWLSVLLEDLLVRVCIGSAATYPLLLGSVEGRLCSAKGCCSFLSRHHYNRALSSCAFSLPGGAYKTIGVFWVQFGVLVFQWCISIVLQEFIYLFICPFMYNPNVLSAYCNKNC